MSADRGASIGRALDAKRTRIRGLSTCKLERFDKTTRFSSIVTVPRWWDLVRENETGLFILKVVEQVLVTRQMISDAKAVTVDSIRYYLVGKPRPFGATKKWELTLSENQNDNA